MTWRVAHTRGHLGEYWNSWRTANSRVVELPGLEDSSDLPPGLQEDP